MHLPDRSPQETPRAPDMMPILTLSLPSTTTVPYANSLDPDDTPSNSASLLDPSCLIPRQHFHRF